MGGYGSDKADRYVATYKLSHSKDGLTWVEYRENGQIKVSGLNLLTCKLKWLTVGLLKLILTSGIYGRCNVHN